MYIITVKNLMHQKLLKNRINTNRAKFKV